MSSAYLDDCDRQAVREEVQARLAKFEANERLVMSVEMLSGLAGRRNSQEHAIAPHYPIPLWGIGLCP